jgi:hypothetical protein
MRLATLIGRLAADIVAVLRDKPMIPCQVEWDYRAHFVEPMFNAPRPEWVWTHEDDEEGDVAVDTIQEYRDTAYPQFEFRDRAPQTPRRHVNRYPMPGKPTSCFPCE